MNNKIEYEVRIVKIDVNELKKKLMELGAIKEGEYNYKRYIYYPDSNANNKWMRLRTDGKNTTLTIKECTEKTISGTKELEIGVSNLEDTKLLLKQLGYESSKYMENKRERYILENVEIDFDTWPMIETFLEIEANSEEEVLNAVKKLGFKNEDITIDDVYVIYEEIYKIDARNMKELKF